MKQPNREIHADYRVQVLDRTFAILSVLSESNQVLGPTDLGKRLNLSKSTVHRLLNVLEKHRYVERDAESTRYRLGLRLAELGSFTFPGSEYEEGAKPYLETLAAQTGEAAHLGVLWAGEIVSIVHAAGTNDFCYSATVGRRSPIHCTSLGKAILAFHSRADELIRSHHFIAHTTRTIRNPGLFKAELTKVRLRGIAVDDEEYQEGMRCIGAPVYNAAGTVIAAVSIAGPRTRITAQRSAQLAQSVRAAARDISKSLAHHSDSSRLQVQKAGA